MAQIDVQPKRNKWLTWLIIIIIIGLIAAYLLLGKNTRANADEPNPLALTETDMLPISV